MSGTPEGCTRGYIPVRYRSWSYQSGILFTIGLTEEKGLFHRGWENTTIQRKLAGSICTKMEHPV